MKMSKYKIIITLSLMVALIAGATFKINAQSVDKKSYKKVLDYGLVYSVLQSGQDGKIKAFTKIDSKEQLINYAKKAKNDLSIVKDNYLNKNIPITVTFKQPLTIDEFTELVGKYKINVQQFKMRLVDEKGNRVTLGGSLNDNETVPLDKLTEMTKRHPGDKIKGVIAFYGDIAINESNLEQLKNEGKIFVVDASSELIKDEVKNEYNLTSVNNPKIPDLFWYVEDYGM